MANESVLYFCHTCCRVFESYPEAHEHDEMVECHPGELDDERRKPIIDKNGHVMTRAPRWYLEAIGVIKPD